MKTETKKAEELIEKLKIIETITLKDDLLDVVSKNIHISECQQHKETCQRWLKWLRSKEIKILVELADINACHDKYEPIEEKIQDLKTAIKLYKQEGI